MNDIYHKISSICLISSFVNLKYLYISGSDHVLSNGINGIYLHVSLDIVCEIFLIDNNLFTMFVLKYEINDFYHD